jgi:COMPASS component SWD1
VLDVACRPDGIDGGYSWSRNSRFVLTSSKDWNVIVWDLASECDPPQRFTTVRFDAPVVSASFHPRNRYVSPIRFPLQLACSRRSCSNIILALLSTGEAYVTDLRKEHRSRVELCEAQVQEDSDDEGHPSSSRSRYLFSRFAIECASTLPDLP